MIISARDESVVDWWWLDFRIAVIISESDLFA